MFFCCVTFAAMCIDASEVRPDANSVRYLIESDSPTVLLIRGKYELIDNHQTDAANQC